MESDCPYASQAGVREMILVVVGEGVGSLRLALN